jgi:E3 ubiquitin-protein ligase MGRN1
MGNRNSTPQEQQQGQNGGAPPPPPHTTYAQYPSPQTYRPNQMMPPHVPPPHQPTYYPPSNGQYYGGWAPPVPRPPPHPYMHPQPYPHGPGPVPPATPVPPLVPLPPTQQLTQTATIRNSVNLKKQSLEVKPLDATRLGICFTFDASAPCIVSTFVLATEDGAKGNKLTTAFQTPGPAVHYPKGLGHKFPPSSSNNSTTSSSGTITNDKITSSSISDDHILNNGNSKNKNNTNVDEITNSHVIDLSLHEADIGALSSANGNTFPLVIRLEVITDRGIKDGHSLDELVPGAEQQTWAQSQTTFAALHKEEDGSWSVRVLKQKIWVDGTSYELQEIYGLEQAGKRTAGTSTGGGGMSAAEEAEERLCVICLVNPRDTTVLPCRHMCLCSDCASELRKQSSKCPICRNNIESLLHIRINKENKDKGGEQPASKVDGEVNEHGGRGATTIATTTI